MYMNLGHRLLITFTMSGIRFQMCPMILHIRVILVVTMWVSFYCPLPSLIALL